MPVKENDKLSGKVVVVTGASAGVGRATARRFARAGASLALIARDAASLNETKAEMESIGAKAEIYPLDVADAEAVFAAAQQVEAQLGPIDVWINDAMLAVFSPVHEITPEEFRRVTEVTYLGYVHGTMAALRTMRLRNHGVIIQVGSALAYRGIPLQAAYCGAKHAIRGFTDSLRAELRHERSAIKLVMVQLPAMNTPQFDWARTHMPREPRPVAPVIQPEIAAEAIFDASLRPKREVWLGMSTLEVIVGNMIAPGFLDRYLAAHAFGGQETQKPTLAGREDNLDVPVKGLHRVHGSFGREARSSAVALSGEEARIGAALVWIGLGGLLGYLARRPRR